MSIFSVTCHPVFDHNSRLFPWATSVLQDMQVDSSVTERVHRQLKPYLTSLINMLNVKIDGVTPMTGTFHAD